MAPLSAEAIVTHLEIKPELIERIAHRSHNPPLEIVPPNPAWPQIFLILKQRIIGVLGEKVQAIHHTGSTSVPDLPAKAVIDIDLVVRNVTDEDSYVPSLEAAGFQFLFREPAWHGHRFFVASSPQSANLHVWGPDCPEVERHLIFRDWLLKSPEDRAAYARIKEEAALETRATDGQVMDYNLRKEKVLRQILERAFKDLGYL